MTLSVPPFLQYALCQCQSEPHRVPRDPLRLTEVASIPMGGWPGFSAEDWGRVDGTVTERGGSWGPRVRLALGSSGPPWGRPTDTCGGGGCCWDTGGDGGGGWGCGGGCWEPAWVKKAKGSCCSRDRASMATACSRREG